MEMKRRALGRRVESMDRNTRSIYEVFYEATQLISAYLVAELEKFEQTFGRVDIIRNLSVNVTQ